MAPAAPGLLQKAGVKFALYSDGIEQPRELQRAVKKAIDAGLPREDAIRALTLSAAEIYGVADRLGSIETGKIGNLVVTKGDLFDNMTKVEMIFVDGRQYRPEPEHAGPGRPRHDDEQSGGEPMRKLFAAAACRAGAPVRPDDRDQERHRDDRCQGNLQGNSGGEGRQNRRRWANR